MAAHTKIKIFYISFGFWLIIGVESYSSRSNKVLYVQTGGSVTIPCHYDKKYTQQKKYWYSENDNTYKNTSEENLSIIDHPDQSFFTVTMRNLQNKHTGHYFCVVETGEQPSTKIIYEPYLKIQSAPDVSVVSSSVSGHEGGDISVQCLYSSDYQNKLKQWCRYKDQSCYTVGRTVTSQISSVQISDDDGRRYFTVLMTGLRLTDSGWYYCSVGDALSSVHITVVEAKPGTVSDKENQTAILKNHNNETKETEKPPNNEPLIVWLLPALAALLLLLILVGVFTWRLRPKQDKHHIRGRNGSRTTDMIYSKPEDPVVLYSTINDEIPHDPNNDITYSIIDDVPRSEVMKSPAGGAIYSIIYSTVGPH
uniref:Si:dkeyp-104b3.18 n=1 Tax=Cyprinus carpio TaxID=7962 RepID=A0A8C2FCN6_CYPCA